MSGDKILQLLQRGYQGLLRYAVSFYYVLCLNFLDTAFDDLLETQTFI